MWTIDLPTFIQKSANKRLALNLNEYRNWHYRDQHYTKEVFEKLARELLKGIPKQDKVHLHYVLWAPTSQRRDLMNVIAVVDKYFSDALSKSGVIDDDSTRYIVSVSTSFGGVDRPNPRVSVSIIPVDSPIEINLQ
jgi:Holliday junction resolvase RusA-like endonuclease